ncbi:MAG: hypothetical protein ACRD04_02460 [Terriglobales bacterium]
MALLHRAPSLRRLPPGIVASRRLADMALLRLFSRARRRGTPLLLARLARSGRSGGELPEEFLLGLAAGVRIGDLVWFEPGAEILLLLEDAEDGTAVQARLQERARQLGVELDWHSAQFPRHGLSLDALLEKVRWRP